MVPSHLSRRQSLRYGTVIVAPARLVRASEVRRGRAAGDKSAGISRIGRVGACGLGHARVIDGQWQARAAVMLARSLALVAVGRRAARTRSCHDSRCGKLLGQVSHVASLRLSPGGLWGRLACGAAVMLRASVVEWRCALALLDVLLSFSDVTSFGSGL